MMNDGFYVYIMSNASKTLYIGYTGDLKRRIHEHKSRAYVGFTASYNISSLVYFEKHETENSAIKRERQLKNWHRQWKVNLIESTNKDWKDLENGMRLKIFSIYTIDKDRC